MVVDRTAGNATSDAQVLLIQFARSPVPGEVKTRMIPALTPQQASDLHSELVTWTCERLCSAGVGTVELWVSGDLAHPVIEHCRSLGVAAVRAQVGDDLGERMCYALTDGLARYKQVILVGSDCPSIDKDYLLDAVSELSNHAIVLGPANDGGYVMIGVTQAHPQLFSGISWGQSSVYAETVAVLQHLGLSWASLQSLPDIDRPEDLPVWQAISERRANSH
jgi:rSAM/selenodomain-associated transferase 1